MMRYITFFLFIFYNCINAQNTLVPSIKNKAVLSVGSTASIFSKFAFADTVYNLYRSQTLPALNIGFDFKSNNNFTFGITLLAESFSFSKFDSSGNIFLTKNNKLATSGKFSKKDASFFRINPGIKLLYHYTENDNDIYAGTRIGYETFTTSPITFVFSKKLVSKTTFQILMGYRRHINEWAFNCELAIGKPYWFYAGVCYKFLD